MNLQIIMFVCLFVYYLKKQSCRVKSDEISTYCWLPFIQNSRLYKRVPVDSNNATGFVLLGEARTDGVGGATGRGQVGDR